MDNTSGGGVQTVITVTINSVVNTMLIYGASAHASGAGFIQPFEEYRGTLVIEECQAQKILQFN